MASAYLAITFLKQNPLSEKQLRIFLNYLPQEPLKEYLSYSGIYNGKKNSLKRDLIEMIICEKDITKTEDLQDDKMQEEAIKLLGSSNFAKPKSNIKH